MNDMAIANKPIKVTQTDLTPDWHVIDAQGRTLGRISSEIATLLQGKHKAVYVPNMNAGDYVVVINAEKVRVTGNKLEAKMYYRHSGYHGGLREEKLSDVLRKHPTRVIEHAVKGMLPKSALGRRMMSRMKVYAGDSHPHEAQVTHSEKERQAAEEAATDE